MNGYNHVVLMGNLAKDPEAKYTQSGTCIASFPLAKIEKSRVKTESGKMM
jgi:single-stranded DNA-binding protein